MRPQKNTWGNRIPIQKLKEGQRLRHLGLQYVTHPYTKRCVYFLLAVFWFWEYALVVRYTPWHLSRTGVPYFWEGLAPTMALLIHAFYPSKKTWCIIVLLLIMGWVLHFRTSIQFWVAHFGVKIDGPGVAELSIYYVFLLAVCLCFLYLMRTKPGDRDDGFFVFLRRHLHS